MTHTVSAARERSPSPFISLPRRVAHASARTGSRETTVAMSESPKLREGPMLADEEQIPRTPSVHGIRNPKDEVSFFPV